LSPYFFQFPFHVFNHQRQAQGVHDKGDGLWASSGVIFPRLTALRIADSAACRSPAALSLGALNVTGAFFALGTSLSITSFIAHGSPAFAFSTSFPVGPLKVVPQERQGGHSGLVAAPLVPTLWTASDSRPELATVALLFACFCRGRIVFPDDVIGYHAPNAVFWQTFGSAETSPLSRKGITLEG
jgi:hypothetical protein